MTNHVWRTEQHTKPLLSYSRSNCEAPSGRRAEDVKSRPDWSSSLFQPSKSHNRLTRSCDISSDPTEIHQIWKRFSEGTACYIWALLIFPLCCLAKRGWTFDTRRTDILYPSASINQSWERGDVETGGGNAAFFSGRLKGQKLSVGVLTEEILYAL